jgi:hypothetical protein
LRLRDWEKPVTLDTVGPGAELTQLRLLRLRSLSYCREQRYGDHPRKGTTINTK